MRRNILRVWYTVLLCVVAADSFALVPPTYVPPVSKVGGAIGQSVAENLIRRGMAADDPRLASTVRAISARAAPLVADTAGATWLTAAARMTPWVVGGVAVYQGVTWWFDTQGKAYLAKPGTTTSDTVFSNGISKGATVYYLSNQAGVYAGSLQEAYSYLTAGGRASWPDASYGVPTITQTNTNTWSVQYNYSIPSINLNNRSASVIGYSVVYTGTIICPNGSVLLTGTGACSSAKLSEGPYANAPIVGYPLDTAYANLPAEAKPAAMTPDLAAELANRHWQDAANQPGYSGYPFPASNPVTPADAGKLKTAYPQAWPANSDLVQPIPTASGSNPVTTPILYPPSPSSPSTTVGTTTGTTTNADGTKSTTTSTTTIDWGQFTPPDLDTPTIESILDPLFSMWPSWQHFAFPQHASVCPTPSFTLPASVMGGYTLNFTQLCEWTEMVRPTMQACFAVAWAILIVFIVMGA